MSSPLITLNGTLGAYEQPIKYGVDSSGGYIVRTWRGSADAIIAQYYTCVAAGALAELKAGLGTHTVEARYSIPQVSGSGSETPIDSWEFFASHVEKDMLEADIPLIESIGTGNKTRIRSFLTTPIEIGQDAYGPGDFDELESDPEDAFEVFTLMMNGMRAVRVQAPALRHSQTVSNQWAVKASLTNVGKIISSATLATAESIPSSVLFNLPSDVSSRTGLSYGWMKMHPTIRCGAKQKMQIEQEYEYGLWADLIYGTPI